MDAIDINLVNLLQEGLPLERDPYGIIARQLEITRSEVLKRIKELYQEDLIRRLGGTFNNAAMGYTSILFGLQVTDDIFSSVAAYVNSFKNVTHNYQRSGFLNMWFTFAFTDLSEKEVFLKGLEERFRITKIYEFPNLRNYKLNVFFDMEGR